MIRVTRIDVAAETSSVAAIVRDAGRIGSWFYRPGEVGAPAEAHIEWAEVSDERALWRLAARVQRGLEFTNGAPAGIEAYLVVIGTLLEGD